MNKVYLVAGKSGHGKDTVASIIKSNYEKKGLKTIILQISSPLKYYATKVLDWDGLEKNKPRSFLQDIGIKVIRQNMGDKFLIHRLVDDMKILFNYCDCIIISDVRLSLEINTIKKLFDDVTSILINRPNFQSQLSLEQRNHVTETSLDNYDGFDYIIENIGTINDLENKIKDILKEEV